jgi:hypothetical protein
MGQYYLIVNVTKKQFMHPHHFSSGMKLMEWSYVGNYLTNALHNLLYNEWKGDEVYVVGDYADLNVYGCEDYNWHDTYAELHSRFDLHDGEYEEYPDSYSLFSYVEANFTPLSQEDVVCAECGIRYVYNHASKQVIDLCGCPKDRWGMVACPTSLLLAMGNGRGGGDYHDSRPGYEYVGYWVATCRDIEVSPEPLPDCDGYEPFDPEFVD